MSERLMTRRLVLICETVGLVTLAVNLLCGVPAELSLGIVVGLACFNMGKWLDELGMKLTRGGGR